MHDQTSEDEGSGGGEWKLFRKCKAAAKYTDNFIGKKRR